MQIFFFFFRQICYVFNMRQADSQNWLKSKKKPCDMMTKLLLDQRDPVSFSTIKVYIRFDFTVYFVLATYPSLQEGASDPVQVLIFS